MSNADFSLGLPEWLLLGAYGLLIFSNLLVLLLPLRLLGMSRRPRDFAAVAALSGLFGGSAVLAMGFRAELWVLVALLSLQGAVLTAPWAMAFVWRRRQRARSAEPRAPVDEDEQLMTEVRQLLSAGDRIGAICRLREETGAGLLEAKQVVERLG